MSKSELVTKNKIQTKLELKEINEDGTFKGYGSIFGNKDSGYDIVMKGAFSNSLTKWQEKNSLPALLWQHNHNEPIGKYISMKEDSKGLQVEGKLSLGTTRGKDAYELLKDDAISGLSIGYSVEDYEYDETKDAFLLKELDLWEVSLVTFPMNEKAQISQVKQILKSGEVPEKKDFEKILRDAGLSRKQATAFVANGHKGAFPQSDSEQDECVNLLKNIFGGQSG